MSNIGNLANSIYINEFDSTGVTVESISGWLDNNIGQLNNVLYTSFSGLNGEVDGLNLEEQSIYKEMYLYHYYTKQTRNTIRGIADDTDGNILSVRDGDNAITFVNKNEVSKVYKSLAQDAYDGLQSLIVNYNSYQSSPRQVGGIEAL
mgnify:CR=1 FL=1|jgi:hypothetical protein|tara:strand:+ start:2503 stop:2946 length:444 start_codon:yes stop_codon:yes gene_type:complete